MFYCTVTQELVLTQCVFTRNKINPVPSFSLGRMLIRETNSGHASPRRLPWPLSLGWAFWCLLSLWHHSLHSCLHRDLVWKGITPFPHTRAVHPVFLQNRENLGCMSWWIKAVTNRSEVQLWLFSWELQWWQRSYPQCWWQQIPLAMLAAPTCETGYVPYLSGGGFWNSSMPKSLHRVHRETT